MPNILIVDDSAVDRTLAGKLLEREDDVELSFATNGREALDSIEATRPDVIVSDLQMPEMDGLELVAEVRRNYPSVPVILMTAKGSEESATEAIKIGAAGFVPKVSLGTNLRVAVRQLFDAAELDQIHSRLFHSLKATEFSFELRDDPDLIGPLVEQVQETLRCLPLGDASERLRVSIAVGHALWIAHFHGNLEMALNETWSDGDFAERAAAIRREQTSDRSIQLHAVVNRNQAEFRITHEGAPIELAHLPSDLKKAVAERSWLSGFLMIPVVMDEVTWNDRGITVVKNAVCTSDDDMELG